MMTMGQNTAPLFSQAAIDNLRNSEDFKRWNRDFENLKRAIARQVSPRDMQPLLRAGCSEDKLLTLLAFVVYDYEGVPPVVMKRRRALESLASQLETVANHATRVANDPFCDGRFWLALLGGLSWDLLPKPGIIEAPVIKRMRDLAELFRKRGEALGQHSRLLAKVMRNRGMLDLVAYASNFVGRSGQFDSELAYLLNAADRAAVKSEFPRSDRIKRRRRHFTAESVKKFRQRHVPKVTKDVSLVTEEDLSRTKPASAESLRVFEAERISPPKRKTVGQLLAEMSVGEFTRFGHGRRDN